MKGDDTWKRPCPLSLAPLASSPKVGALGSFCELHLSAQASPFGLIGSAGVSAVPMAARVSQIEGQKANPSNFLLMHAMGPNVAGVIGSAIAAGFLLAVFK